MNEAPIFFKISNSGITNEVKSMYSVETGKEKIELGFHDNIIVNRHYLKLNGNTIAVFSEGYIGEAIRCCDMLNKGG